MSINKAACIASGMIGTGWALTFAWKGLQVNVYDIADDQINNAKNTLEKYLGILMKYSLIDGIKEADAIKARINFTTDIDVAVEDVSFIQESGPEDLKVKQQIICSIEKTAASDVVIATSTSGLMVSDIAECALHPERIVGGHPYNPTYLIPLVEIVRGRKTTSGAARIAYDFYKNLGKEPVILNKEVAGFIANRLQVALYREVIDLVIKGVCSVEDADRAVLYGPGIRWGIMGPNLIFHLGAGDLGISALLKNQRESFSVRAADLANWSEIPEHFFKIASEGVKKEVNNLPEYIGKTIPDLMDWRDRMIIEILKLQGKI